MLFAVAGTQASGSERTGGDADLRRLYGIFGAAGAAFIPFYALLLRDRGLAADRIGVILAVTSLAGVVATPFWSHAADRRLGSAHTLQLACALACVAELALMATGSSIVAIGACAVALGAAQGPQTAMTDALTLGRLGPLRLTEYGSFRVWASIGWGVGAVAFGAIFTALGLRAMLPFAAVGLAVVALFVSRFPDVSPARRDERGSRFGSVGEAFRVSRMPTFLAGVLILATSTHAAWDFVPLRIVAGGGGAFLVGISSGVSAFVEIPFMRSTRSLTARFGLRRVFALGAVVYVAASIAWALVADAVAVTAIRIAIGIGFGLVYPTLVVITGRLVPEHARNSGQALMSICSFGLAPVIGGAIGGVVYEHVGPPQLFAGSAVGIAVGAAVVWTAAHAVDRLPDPVSE
jgi:MFS transporter, PPP family, 3-phenylpropionic acid transporter